MTEFTSGEIQNGVYKLSGIYTLLFTTVQWLSCLDKEALANDKTYLINARIEIKEDYS